MKRIFILCLTCACLFSFVAIAFAVAPNAPTDTVEMKFPGEKAKYAPIIFEHHERHLAVENSCESCHHKWDGAAEVTGCRVEGCHADFSKANKREPTSYDWAFHTKKSTNSCVGCHSALLKANPEFKGPKKCNACHSKKKG